VQSSYSDALNSDNLPASHAPVKHSFQLFFRCPRARIRREWWEPDHAHTGNVQGLAAQGRVACAKTAPIRRLCGGQFGARTGASVCIMPRLHARRAARAHPPDRPLGPPDRGDHVDWQLDAVQLARPQPRAHRRHPARGRGQHLDGPLRRLLRGREEGPDPVADAEDAALVQVAKRHHLAQRHLPADPHVLDGRRLGHGRPRRRRPDRPRGRADQRRLAAAGVPRLRPRVAHPHRRAPRPRDPPDDRRGRRRRRRCTSSASAGAPPTCTSACCSAP
jgi:hypothetical protein